MWSPVGRVRTPSRAGTPSHLAGTVSLWEHALSPSAAAGSAVGVAAAVPTLLQRLVLSFLLPARGLVHIRPLLAASSQRRWEDGWSSSNGKRCYTTHLRVSCPLALTCWTAPRAGLVSGAHSVAACCIAQNFQHNVCPRRCHDKHADQDNDDPRQRRRQQPQSCVDKPCTRVALASAALRAL